MKGNYLVRFVYVNGTDTAITSDYNAWQKFKVSLQSNQLVALNDCLINMRNVLYIELIDND